MVAAAKLRRAQEQARRGPYLCENHGQGVLASLGAGHPGRPAHPKLLAGTGSDEDGASASSSPRPIAACAAASTATIVRVSSRASHPQRFKSEGKTVKILRGPQGPRPAASPHYGSLIVEYDRPISASRAWLSRTRSKIADRACWMFEAGEFDVATLIYNALQVGDQPDRHPASSLIPPLDAGRRPKGRLSGASYELRAG